MALRNCSRCGNLFPSVGRSRVCPDCVKVEHQQFLDVKDYLWKNPRAPAYEVSQATGVPQAKILEWVRHGRLTAESANTDLAVACESCGARIPKGRLCSACAAKLGTRAAGTSRGTVTPVEEPPRTQAPGRKGPAPTRTPASPAKSDSTLLGFGWKQLDRRKRGP